MGQGFRHPEHPYRHAAANSLATGDDVGRQAEVAGPAAVHGKLRVRLVDDEQGVVLTREVAEFFVEAGLWHHESAVGHHRLEQHCCDVATRQGARRSASTSLKGMVTTSRPDRAAKPSAVRVAIRPHHLVEVTVVLRAEDQQLGPPGERAGQPQCVDVGAARGQRVLPLRQAEPVAEQHRDVECVFGREEEVVALGGLRGDGSVDGSGANPAAMARSRG